MSKQRETLKLALDALDCIYSPLHVREINKVGEAMVAIREALAEPEQEPVYQISLTNGSAKAAWIDVDEATYYSAKMDAATYMARCLYTAPPARKPLTDNELWEMWVESPSDVLRFARAIERAHGISE